MATAKDRSRILGIIMLILGLLLLVGRIGLPFSTEIVGAALVVVAVLMLLGKLSGGTGWAIAVGVVGLLLLLAPLPVLRVIVGALGGLLELVIGVLLVVFGILRIAR